MTGLSIKSSKLIKKSTGFLSPIHARLISCAIIAAWILSRAPPNGSIVSYACHSANSRALISVCACLTDFPSASASRNQKRRSGLILNFQRVPACRVQKSCLILMQHQKLGQALLPTLLSARQYRAVRKSRFLRGRKLLQLQFLL